MTEPIAEYVTLTVTLNDAKGTTVRSAPILNDATCAEAVRGAFLENYDHINFPTLGLTQVFIRASEISRIEVIQSTKTDYDYWRKKSDERTKD